MRGTRYWIGVGLAAVAVALTLIAQSTVEESGRAVWGLLMACAIGLIVLAVVVNRRSH